MLLMTGIDFGVIYFVANANIGRALILHGIELCWLHDHMLALCISI